MTYLLLIVLVVVFPLGVRAATCTFGAGASTIGPIGTETGAGTSCAPATSSDLLVIPSGATVTVVEDVIQVGTNSTGWQVDSGGSLVVDVANKTGGAGDLILQYGGAEIACNGTCQFHGGFRSAPGRGSSDTPSVLSAPETARFFQVGRIVPCHVAGDCSTTDNTRIRWEYETGTNASAWDAPDHNGANLQDDINFGAHFEAIAAGDIVCLWAPDTRMFPDRGQCYDVLAASGASDPHWIELETDQGSDSTGGLSFALRQIGYLSTDEKENAGSRTVVASASFASGDGLFTGRFLRFTDLPEGAVTGQTIAALGSATCPTDAGFVCQVTDADGDCATASGADTFWCRYNGGAAAWEVYVPQYEPWGYKLGLWEQSTLDIAHFADRRGLVSGKQAGTEFIIDYGWRTGDPFVVLVPVRLNYGATIAVSTDGVDVGVTGTLDAMGVSADRGGLVLSAGATITQLGWWWLQDMQPATVGGVDVTAQPNLDIGPLLFTGGGVTTPTSGAANGLVVRCSRGEVDGLYARHLGGYGVKVLDSESSSSACSGSDASDDTRLHVTHMSVQVTRDDSPGGGAVDPSDVDVDQPLVDVDVGLFEDSTGPSSTEGALFEGWLDAAGTNPPARESQIRDTVALGLRTGFFGRDVGSEAWGSYWSFSDLWVGFSLQQDAGATLPLLPPKANHFLARDGRSESLDNESAISSGTIDWSSGVIQDYQLSDENFGAVQYLEGSTFTDLVALNFTRLPGSGSTECVPTSQGTEQQGCRYFLPDDYAQPLSHTALDSFTRVVAGYTEGVYPAASQVIRHPNTTGTSSLRLHSLGVFNFSEPNNAIEVVGLNGSNVIEIYSNGRTEDGSLCYWNAGLYETNATWTFLLTAVDNPPTIVASAYPRPLGGPFFVGPGEVTSPWNGECEPRGRLGPRQGESLRWAGLRVQDEYMELVGAGGNRANAY